MTTTQKPQMTDRQTETWDLIVEVSTSLADSFDGELLDPPENPEPDADGVVVLPLDGSISVIIDPDGAASVRIS